MSLTKISKSNHLVESSYKLSLKEQRLILVCLSKIDPRGPVPKEISVTASEYSRLMHVANKNAYRELFKAASDIYNRSIVVFNREKKEEFRWVQKKTTCQKGEGKVTLVWSEEVLKYISQLSSRFTSYHLHNVAKLGTPYAIRLYELLIQFQTTKERTIKLDDFRSYLQLKNKYQLFKDLSKRVIKPALEEINKKSNLNAFYSPVKSGRRVTSLYFEFKEK